jgi:putative flippase GtrA
MTKRMVRVGVSGVVATSIDVAALVFLVEAMRSHVTLAAFLAAALGGVCNFLINKYWAFRDGGPIDLRQVTVYIFVSLITAAFVAVAVHLLAVVMGLPYLLAKAIAAGLVFLVWTYPAQSKLVFPATQCPQSFPLAESLAEPRASDSLSLGESLALE